jgi:hypothetical protein
MARKSVATAPVVGYVNALPPDPYEELAMKATLNVRYVSGREEQYEIDLWGGGAGGRARLEEFIDTPNLALNLGNELVVIPGTAVERYSMTMAKTDGGGLDLSTIRTARRIK